MVKKNNRLNLLAVSKNFFRILPYNMIFDKRNTSFGYDMDLLDTKIKIYEDRVNGWFLEIANELNKNNEAGFVILMICLSHIEGVVQLKKGKSSKGNSAKLFTEYIRRLFRVHKTVANAIYEDMRCGLFHDGMSRKRIAISKTFKEPVMIDENRLTIGINPSLFLRRIQEDFDKYIKQLENTKNKKLRSNFNKIWDA